MSGGAVEGPSPAACDVPAAVGILVPPALLGAVILAAVVASHGLPLGPGGRPLGGGAASAVADAVVVGVVQARVPALLGLIAGRLAARAGRNASRSAVMTLAAGGVATILGAPADLLGVLGLSALLAGILARGARWVSVLVGVLLMPGVVAAGFGLGAGGPGMILPGPDASWTAGAVERLAGWLVGLALFPLSGGLVALGAVVGVLLPRRDSLRAGSPLVLVTVAVVGVSVSLVGAVPLTRAAVLAPDAGVSFAEAGWGVVHALTALPGAVGAAALAALVAPGSGRRPPPGGVVTRWLAWYAAATTLVGVAMSPWGFDLGSRATTGRAVVVATVAWLVGGAIAWVLRSRTAGGGPRSRGRHPHRPGQRSTELQGRARRSAT